MAKHGLKEWPDARHVGKQRLVLECRNCMADTEPAGQHDSRLRPTEYPGNCPQILDPFAFGPAGRARTDFETRDFGNRRHWPKEFAEPLGFVPKIAIAGESIDRKFVHGSGKALNICFR